MVAQRYGKLANSIRTIYNFSPLVFQKFKLTVETEWQNSKFLCAMYKFT